MRWRRRDQCPELTVEPVVEQHPRRGPDGQQRPYVLAGAIWPVTRKDVWFVVIHPHAMGRRNGPVECVPGTTVRPPANPLMPSFRGGTGHCRHEDRCKDNAGYERC